MEESHVHAFESKGFHHMKGALGPAEVARFRSLLQEMSGVTRETFERRDVPRGPLGRRVFRLWTCPDGVTRNEPFWDVVFTPGILDRVRALLRVADVRFLQHTDLHAGFSANAWHRDSVNNEVGEGPEWDESIEPYKNVRVGIYLQSYQESGFRMGFVDGSHRRERTLTRLERRINKRVRINARLLGNRFLTSKVTWIAPQPGDAIIFDHRMLHIGSYIHGPKFSVFLAYGVENRHFRDHWHYYRHRRHDLAYGPMPAPFQERLRAAGLLPERALDAHEFPLPESAA